MLYNKNIVFHRKNHIDFFLVLALIREKKNHIYRWQHEAANIYGKNDSTVHEMVKKEREIYASFAVTSQAAKVMATVPDK